jgi:hypothetical protein
MPADVSAERSVAVPVAVRSVDIVDGVLLGAGAALVGGGVALPPDVAGAEDAAPEGAAPGADEEPPLVLPVPCAFASPKTASAAIETRVVTNGERTMFLLKKNCG